MLTFFWGWNERKYRFSENVSNVLVDIRSLITGFVYEFYQPLNHRENALEIKSLYLKGFQLKRAFHLCQRLDYYLWEPDFLSQFHAVLIVDVYIEIWAGNGPGHPAKEFIEWLQPCYSASKVTSQQQKIENLFPIKQFLLVLMHTSLIKILIYSLT